MLLLIGSFLQGAKPIWRFTLCLWSPRQSVESQGLGAARSASSAPLSSSALPSLPHVAGFAQTHGQRRAPQADLVSALRQAAHMGRMYGRDGPRVLSWPSTHALNMLIDFCEDVSQGKATQDVVLIQNLPMTPGVGIISASTPGVCFLMTPGCPNGGLGQECLSPAVIPERHPLRLVHVVTKGEGSLQLV